MLELDKVGLALNTVNLDDATNASACGDKMFELLRVAALRNVGGLNESGPVER